MPSKFVALMLALMLAVLPAGCGSLPRGAGIERELLAHKNEVMKPDGSLGQATKDPAKSGEMPSQFAVEPVIRANMAKYANWPVVGDKSRAWLTRVDQPNTRILVPGDIVNVVIWNSEDNSLLTAPGQRVMNMTPMQLTSGGKVFLPYIGQIKLSDMSPEHAREAIQQAYIAVAPSVQVQLSVAEGRNSTASLLSGVGSPGPYPLPDQDFTLLDLLALGGGISASIANPQIRLQRGDRTYGISAGRLKEDTSLNTTLKGGDRVFVEEDDRTFLSLGATGSEAPHRFPKDNLSALEAISLIGGLTDARANPQGILILRNYPAKSVQRDGSGPRHIRTIFTIDLTSADGLFSADQFAIRPGDVIYATESPLIGTRNVFALIGSIFGLSNQLEAQVN